MRFFGLPSYDRLEQALVHRKFRTPICDIEKVERVSAMGFLWGVRITEFSGIERTCVSATRGAARAAAEEILERSLFSLMEGAKSYWRQRIASEMASGAFVHRGVVVSASGEITTSAGGSATLTSGRLRHEIDGEVLRLKFVSSSSSISIDWKPGLARDAVISLIYETKEKFRKLRLGRPDPETDRLRLKAKQRINDVISRLATVLARLDTVDGRMRLSSFCSSRGMAVPEEAFRAVAPRLLIRKSFIQTMFEDIMRYHERTRQSHRSGELFEDFTRLAVYEGKLTARQLFALYEIGLHLGYGLPRITAIISAVQTGGDPRAAGDEVDRREVEEATRRAQARIHAGDFAETEGGADEGGFDDFDDFDASPPPPVVPLSLIPMMEILGIDILTDERTLRVAWTARVRACHPDTLHQGASLEEVEAATQAAAECNMAYSLLLEHLKASR